MIRIICKIRAKRGEKNTQEKLLEMYRPLLMRESTYGAYSQRGFKTGKETLIATTYIKGREVIYEFVQA